MLTQSMHMDCIQFMHLRKPGSEIKCNTLKTKAKGSNDAMAVKKNEEKYEQQLLYIYYSRWNMISMIDFC